MAHITDKAILGMPALCDLGCTLHFVRKHLVCRGLRVPYFDQNRKPVSYKVVHNKVEIPPRCNFLVRSCVKEGAVGELLVKYQDVFSRDDKDLSRISLVKHHIATGDSKPIKQAPRRLPPHQIKEVQK